MAKLSYFDALPPYAGGKRRIVAGVFRHLPPPDAAPVLVDPFGGAMSVSLYAKARGYRVVCGDVALRSVVTGKAVVENDRITLAPEDLLRLFVPDPANDGFVEAHLSPDFLTTRFARFMDNALAVARRAEEPKRSLFLLLLVHLALRLRPMGNAGAVKITRQADAGEWSEMNPHFVRDMLARGAGAHPHTIAEALRRRIARGVFAGAGPCRCVQGDAADLLAATPADIAFMDPPYPYTLDYSKALRPLDEMLEGRPISPGSSSFSGSGWSAALSQVFEAGARIPTWAITYGNAGGKGVSLDELVALVRRFRPVVHAQATAYVHQTGLASEGARANNREFLVIARSST